MCQNVEDLSSSRYLGPSLMDKNILFLYESKTLPLIVQYQKVTYLPKALRHQRNRIELNKTFFPLFLAFKKYIKLY
jgi:hypothetical protein